MFWGFAEAFLLVLLALTGIWGHHHQKRSSRERKKMASKVRSGFASPDNSIRLSTSTGNSNFCGASALRPYGGPPALAALRARASYVVIRQTMLKTLAELDLARTHISKGPKVNISPSYRDLPDPCSLPGELHWIRHTIYSHRIHRAGIDWELAHGRPVWRYANQNVRAP